MSGDESDDEVFASMIASQSSERLLQGLPVSDMLRVIRETGEVAKFRKRRRSEILNMFSSLQYEVQVALITAAQCYRRGVPSPSFSKFRRIQQDNLLTQCHPPFPIIPLTNHDARPSDFDADEFVRPVTETTIRSCLQSYIQATGNNALKEEVCCVCARWMDAKDMENMPLDILPGRQSIQPWKAHHKQFLYRNALLHEEATYVIDGVRHGHVCVQCLNALKKNHTPKFSLANNLWIGEIPFALQRLELAERLLIAKVLPVAYLVKLYPKQINATSWDTSGMHSGMKGNVSSFPLSPRNVIQVASGGHLPHHPSVLPTIFAITFVGPKNCPVPGLPKNLRVRRSCILEGLQCLRMINPLYEDISIDEEILNMYPEDGFPSSILNIARASDDIEQLETERSGYVPESTDEEIVGDHEEQIEEGLASVFPLEALGELKNQSDYFTNSYRYRRRISYRRH